MQTGSGAGTLELTRSEVSAVKIIYLKARGCWHNNIHPVNMEIQHFRILVTSNVQGVKMYTWLSSLTMLVIFIG